MRVGVIHTVGSPCGCAEAVSVGLKALGHEVITANSEDVEFRASELSRDCDLVIDHTDTFRGRGLFRAFVRLILEGYGARLVGSGAQACYVADDKIVSKECMTRAGIATPPSVVVTSKQWRLPPWLKFPLVLKPAFEHMSRGVVVSNTRAEARSSVADMLDRFQQPIIAESYIQGRELAVSILEGPGGPQVLPPLEWVFGEGERLFLTESFKLEELEMERHNSIRAVMSDNLLNQLKGYVLLAFRSLGLRDYARFDIRLTPDETFYFLEANATPSLEPFEALALSAKWAGMDYKTLVDSMLCAAKSRYGEHLAKGETTMTVAFPTGQIRLSVTQGVHVSPPSTIELAGLLDIQPGERVMELGCGTGILSIAAAKKGAKNIVAVDIAAEALDATLHNARLNGVEKQIKVRFGSWYDSPGHSEGVSENGERFDAIIATPPQTPGPFPFGPRYGGADGTKHLYEVIDGAQRFLSPEKGRLWLLVISLANPRGIMMRLKERFRDVVIVHRSERHFSSDEYESIEKGLFEYLIKLRSDGLAEFQDIGNDRYMFHNLFIRASGVIQS